MRILLVLFLFVSSVAFASDIPQAMKWKYGANCTDNSAGDDIEIWESALPRPGKQQVANDVRDYHDYIEAQEAEEAEINAEELVLRQKIVQKAVDELKAEGTNLKHEAKLIKKYKEKRGV